MKKPVILIALLTLIVLCAFTPQDGIKQCYLSFKKTGNLKAQPAEKLPADAEKTRALATGTGETTITITDGYRILYNNKKKAPFVNMKVELSQPENYEQDKKNVLANLNYLNAQSTGMETTGKLLEIDYNGYKVFGLSRAGINEAQTLGIFVIFPGDNTIIYLYFNNIEADKSHFKTVAEYQGYRNEFIGEYTAHLANCK
ncbi:hypothetical protein LJ707_19210 [Mucilaginibacter sp. UR6-1]|uniref:hypothetical protein n=1 Tax=Mucilaginibacter sp. UR6-1 TaxID=1435643 RepID=UPI001E378E98|nr:hypothetical protein [Mucilaginibacter sp. UR6-1]MCC8411078.1 hypothetical protein [Mucilaginibacter sp. UR6-1]